MTEPLKAGDTVRAVAVRGMMFFRSGHTYTVTRDEEPGIYQHNYVGVRDDSGRECITYAYRFQRVE